MTRSIVSFTLLISLALLSALTAGSTFADQPSRKATAGQEATADRSSQLAPTRKAPRGEPLEKYDNPPAPPRKIETSPRMVSPFGVFTSFQVNVDASGQNILGDAANEPAIAGDPTDPNKMVIGWRQLDSINSDIRQGRWCYTTYGGLTWTF